MTKIVTVTATTSRISSNATKIARIPPRAAVEWKDAVSSIVAVGGAQKGVV